MVAAKSGQQIAFTTQAVRRAVKTLSEQRSHEHFPAYLALLRNRNRSVGQRGGLPDIEAFYNNFLRIDGAPKGAPYMQPFRSRGIGVRLLNKNLQGSFAPSSIREGKALSHIIEIVDVKRATGEVSTEYHLKEGHPSITLFQMLSGNRVPFVALTATIWRDYWFDLKKPDLTELIERARARLRIRDADSGGGDVFDTVFYDDSAEFDDSDLFVAGE